MRTQEETVHYRACHLCEAICGLKITTSGQQILSIKGDFDDPLSQGHICPKAVALKDLHTDPDRLRTPVKKVDGHWQPISWDEAFTLVGAKLAEIQAEHGNNSVGIYAGNPNVHNFGHITHGPFFSRLLKTHNRFSATSVDQLPHHVVSYWLYGHQHLLPVPDLDHTDFLLIIGANPAASNGSIMTAPNVRNRLRGILQRGGKVVVLDPRQTETAKLASEHLAIRPGSDAALLLAMLNQLFSTEQIDLGHLAEHVTGLEEVKLAVAPFTISWAAQQTGISEENIERLTRQLYSAKRAAVYGRMGVSTHDYGTLCQWALQMLNLVSGNLDSVGGMLVTHPAAKPIWPGDRQAGHMGRWHSRVRGLPEFGGELPCAVMREEIETEGEGQIRAMVTVAGNPVLSTPSGDKLSAAFEGLEFMVCVDPYINETTCHADVILPPASPLMHDHYDLVFLRLAVRNVARYSPPMFDKPEDERFDWQIFNSLAEAYSAARGDVIEPLPEPLTLLRHWLANGSYGDSLDVEALLKDPHGVDLGPLRPSLSERLCTLDQKIHAWPEQLSTELQRLAAELDQSHGTSGQLKLIGRRDLRTNNSWMHNSLRLVKGKPRCVLQVNPQDLKRRYLRDGDVARLTSSTGSLQVTVEASTDIMPGVVSLPHGWGHTVAESRLSVANEYPGVSINDLTDPQRLDPISGNAVLSGIEVNLSSLDSKPALPQAASWGSAHR